jgi:hypothetical protein
MSYKDDILINIYNSKINDINTKISDLAIIAINNTDSEIEGNYFFSLSSDGSDKITLKYKQANLYFCSYNSDLNICEIGFNAGFSSLLLLLARKNIKSTNLLIFDIGEHKYVKPCLEYIKNNFENNNNDIKTSINYIEGNSITTVHDFINNNSSLIGTFDLIHIDGGHTYECILNDIKNADILLKKNGVIIIDDTNIDFIDKLVTQYILSENYIEIFLFDLSKCLSPHRIIKKIK